MFQSLESLTSIIRTGLPILVELIDLVSSYNCSISTDLTQMVNFPTRIPDCDSHSPAVLDLFISSDATICSTVTSPIRKLWSCCCLTFYFPSNSQRDPSFHCIAYKYSCAGWDGLHDHLRHVLWEDIFKLGASDAASEFWVWVQVGIDVYVPHRKYQVNPHSSQWFSAALLLS